MDELILNPYPGIDTLYKALYRRVEQFGDDNMWGVRQGKEYIWTTYKQHAEKSKMLAAGLTALNLVPEIQAEGKPWRFLAIKSKNRQEWALLHTAGYHNEVTTVALYDTLGPDASAYIIDFIELTTIATSAELTKGILMLKKNEQAGEDRLKRMVNIINMDNESSQADLDLAAEVGITIHKYSDVLEAGRNNTTFEVLEPTAESCFMLSFTSGTTGYPKGVKLTHQMIMGTCEAVQYQVSDEFRFDEKDTYISYLPYSHIFE